MIRPILGIGTGGADMCSLSDDERTLYVGTYRQAYPDWAQLVQIPITPLPSLRAGMTDRGFQVELQGRAGAIYQVQTSPDLVSWTPWLTTNTTDRVVLPETAPATEGGRFYRAVSH